MYLFSTLDGGQWSVSRGNRLTPTPKQDRQCTYKHKIQARSRNHCCSGKAISITYFCVCVCGGGDGIRVRSASAFACACVRVCAHACVYA